MSTASLRTYGTAAVTAALLGAGSFLAPAIAQAQLVAPVDPTDIIKIDSPDLTVNVNGTTANFTVTAPKNMACVGPLVVEGAISEKDIDPETWNETFFEDLFSNPVWPTKESDLRVVVNESSDLLDEEGSASPKTASRPSLRPMRSRLSRTSSTRSKFTSGTSRSPLPGASIWAASTCSAASGANHLDRGRPAHRSADVAGRPGPLRIDSLPF